jgi:hypothetical protein
MARGWESKNVEDQVESKEVKPAASGSGHKDAQQQSREQELKDLRLSRTRISNDLAAATHPNHRKTLEAALAHLDKKIADLG